mmetsp:Transcript_10329/g.36235  ORF Transcript_10329/g.36235 Transcript_10329/m.36235 type:complete len:252 (-) Transcript_10329:489-1244(-)
MRQSGQSQICRTGNLELDQAASLLLESLHSNFADDEGEFEADDAFPACVPSWANRYAEPQLSSGRRLEKMPLQQLPRSQSPGMARAVSLPTIHLHPMQQSGSGRTVHVAAALLLPHQPRFSEVLQSPACSNSPRRNIRFEDKGRTAFRGGARDVSGLAKLHAKHDQGGSSGGRASASRGLAGGAARGSDDDGCRRACGSAHDGGVEQDLREAGLHAHGVAGLGRPSSTRQLRRLPPGRPLRFRPGCEPNPC